MKWVSTKVPEPLVERFHKIGPALGYVSLAQFIGEGFHALLMKKEREYAEIEQEREVGRKVLGKEDSSY